MSFLAKLLEISRSIAKEPSSLTSSQVQLFPLYANKNGIVAFESSLLVLPTVCVNGVPGLEDWNASDGWRKGYDVPSDVVFFGMDIFAGQFGIREGRVLRLDPESGELSMHADSLEDWAKRILSDYNFETGFSVAHEWQSENSPLELGVRLLPKQPFILGGEYSAANVTPWPMRNAMQQLVTLHAQVASIPDGSAAKVTGWLVPDGVGSKK